MEVRHLKTFKTVVDIGGFTRASEYLGYAQSTISSHIQAIEQELGQPLFNRLGKKMILTEVGKHLIPYANQMIELYERAKQIPINEEEPSGNLIIGATDSLTVYRLPSIIQRYKKLYPQVKVTLITATCWKLRDDLRQGKIDVAFLLETERKEEDLNIETLISEPLGLVIPREHPFKNLKFRDVTFSTKESLLYTEYGCSYRSIFENYVKQQGTNPDTIEMWSVEAIKQCVMCGLGISLLPLFTVQTELREEKLSVVLTDEIQISTQLAYHKNIWLTPALNKLLILVREHFK